ncbi:hypothetical protein GE21DRAFT_1221016 [Neurospora crassa]|uniref:Uncharacterized protein B18E6.020 n=1 Tax=Neurospora crassa TaxID=5141 RepID=Q873M2_NEUCS|nr:hypothetical protein GE21DRAFT_1221016 [Neurospora crassa]CAD70282.1 hypothetical protein [Neurospora crassa]
MLQLGVSAKEELTVLERHQTRVDMSTERGSAACSITSSYFRSSNAAGQDSDADRRKRAKWERKKDKTNGEETKGLHYVLKMSGSRDECMADVSMESREKDEMCLKLQ